ncbi:MAG: hypothetical protein ACREAY_03260 [Nitrososphaera sp.]|uniref:hypothetical protein n=1 Tax=Nitrososphaera sp. TaxID=1971748 RepID=UPI003D6E3623
MSGYSEDDVRRAAEIREWLVKQISDKAEELDRLRTTLTLVDSLLKQGSFRAAAAMEPRAQPLPRQTANSQPARQSNLEAAGRDVRPLKRAKDEFVLANAEVATNAITITPAPGVTLSANTPPFRSFFLSRILDGMKGKDAEKVSQGAIKESDTIDYRVEEEGGNIKKITISNYRDKDRLQEIFNTSSWVFTRMLEKAGS